MKEQEIKQIVRRELEKESHHIIKSKEKRAFSKVEKMLNFYKSFKNRIVSLESINLNEIELKKCTGLTLGFGGNYEYKSDEEKKEDIKEKIVSTLDKLKQVVNTIDYALEEIKNEKYFKIIELKYFEKFTIEKIAELLEIDESTVKRNKNTLINELCLIIYPEEIID